MKISKIQIVSVVGVVALVVSLAWFVNYVYSGSNSSSKVSSSSSSSSSSCQTQNVQTSTSTSTEGLVVQDTVIGCGKEVKSGDTISIHYTGKLTDGTVFDSSLPRNTPFSTKIGVGQVIKGWDLGVIGMKIGGKRTLTIPASLGYGERATGKIPANSTLIFELELIGIK